MKKLIVKKSRNRRDKQADLSATAVKINQVMHTRIAITNIGVKY